MPSVFDSIYNQATSQPEPAGRERSFAQKAVGGLPFVGEYLSDDLLPMVGLGTSPEEMAMTQAMADAAKSYENYRPQAAQYRMQALGQTLGLLDPYTQAMGQVYGPSAMPDYSAAMRNPMIPPQAMQPQGPPAPQGPTFGQMPQSMAYDMGAGAGRAIRDMIPQPEANPQPPMRPRQSVPAMRRGE